MSEERKQLTHHPEKCLCERCKVRVLEQRIAELQAENDELKIHTRAYRTAATRAREAEQRANAAEAHVKELEDERDEWDRKEDSWKHSAIKQQHLREAAEAKLQLCLDGCRCGWVRSVMHSSPTVTSGEVPHEPAK